MEQKPRRGRTTVNRVAEYGVPNRGAMDSNLVGPAGDRSRLYKYGRFLARQNTEVGLG